MERGFFYLFYFTFLHNSEVIAYVLVAAISLVMLLKKPSRRYTFFLIGFLVLAFLFEYDKHIVKDLADQTVDTLFLEEGNYRLQWFTKNIFYHIAPFILWIVGWGSVILGITNPQYGRFFAWLGRLFGKKKKTVAKTESETV